MSCISFRVSKVIKKNAVKALDTYLNNVKSFKNVVRCGAKKLNLTLPDFLDILSLNFVSFLYCGAVQYCVFVMREKPFLAKFVRN